MNSQPVENVDIPNSVKLSKFRGNDSNLSNHRSRSRWRQTSGERPIIAERQRTQAAERVPKGREIVFLLIATRIHNL